MKMSETEVLRYAELFYINAKRASCSQKHFGQADHCVEDMQVTAILKTNSGIQKRQFLEQRIIIFFWEQLARFGISVKQFSIT